MRATKDFCKHGHDTRICGRTKWRQCLECQRINGGLHAVQKVQPDIMERMDLEEHLLKVHGLFVLGEPSLIRMQAEHEQAHQRETA